MTTAAPVKKRQFPSPPRKPGFFARLQKRVTRFKPVKPKSPPPRRKRLRRLVAVFMLSGMAGSGVAWGIHEIRYMFSEKARAVNELVKAADRCAGIVDDPYRDRLRSILRASFASSAEILNLNGVTVCLDAGIAEKTERLMGVYYPPSRLLLLRDDGRLHTTWKRVTKPYVTGRVPDVVSTLTQALNELKNPPETMYGSAIKNGANGMRVDWWYMHAIRDDKKPTGAMRLN